MEINRRQKRMLQKQGEVDAEGTPVRNPGRTPSKPPSERTPPAQFVREVRGELRKVVWPSRAETVNYSIVVLVTVVVLTAMIYGLDWAFSTFVLELFDN